MNKLKVLDLFCGAGGASMGYAWAGFDVTGVDLHPQPNYPFTFIKDDVIALPGGFLNEFDLIHASPPCQRYSKMTKTRHADRALEHPDLIQPVRTLLTASGKPYVIENVPGAPLEDPIMLCGSMFSLEVRRHRLFEIFGPLFAKAPDCCHWTQKYVVGVYGHTGNGANRNRARGRGVGNLLADWRRAMGIPWMNRDELAQAIPPAYTQWIGTALKSGGL